MVMATLLITCCRIPPTMCIQQLCRGDRAGLACAGLAIGKDGTVEAIQHLLHDGRDGLLIQLLLAGPWPKHLSIAGRSCQAARTSSSSEC